MKRPRAKTGFYVSEYDQNPSNAALSHCDIPGTSLSVCISENAAFKIAEHYRNRSVPNSLLSRHTQSSGTVTTGILLGRYEVGERKIASIEQLFQVAWRPGSDSEPRPLTPEQIISLLVHDRTKPPPIGFYVLSDRFDSELLNRDLSLFSRHFINPDSLFVLFGRSADQTVAQVFARGNGKTPAHSVNVTLQIDDASTGREAFSSAEQRDEPSGSAFVRPVAPPSAVSAPDLAAKSSSRRIWVVVVLFLLLAGSAWYGVGLRPPLASAPQTDRIGLRIERTGRDVQITWDSASAALHGASLGLFRIRDGVSNKDIRVFPEELKQGRLLYIPASNDLEIHMKVFTLDNRTVEESVRIIDGRSPDRLESTEPPLSDKGTIRARLENLFSAERSSKPQQVSQQAPAVSPAVNYPKPFIPPVAKARVPDEVEAVASSPAPPQFSAQVNEHSTRFLPHQEATPVQPPPAPPSSAPVEQSPVQTPSPSSAADAAATVRPVEQAVSPPKPRRQVPIILPENLKVLISRDITIDVYCTVAADGKVTNVMTPPTMPPLEAHLYALAAASARKWLFTPAQVHGKPVSSDFMITFSFHRSKP